MSRCTWLAGAAGSAARADGRPVSGWTDPRAVGLDVGGSVSRGGSRDVGQGRLVAELARRGSAGCARPAPRPAPRVSPGSAVRSLPQRESRVRCSRRTASLPPVRRPALPAPTARRARHRPASPQDPRSLASPAPRRRGRLTAARSVIGRRRLLPRDLPMGLGPAVLPDSARRGGGRCSTSEGSSRRAAWSAGARWRRGRWVTDCVGYVGAGLRPVVLERTRVRRLMRAPADGAWVRPGGAVCGGPVPTLPAPRARSSRARARRSAWGRDRAAGAASSAWGPRRRCRPQRIDQKSTSTSAVAASSAGWSSVAPMPIFSLIFFSSSLARSGLSRRKFRAFSRPWPSWSLS